ERVTASLEAFWNESAPGHMQQYRGLVHVFASPSAEQRRRFLRAKNRAVVAGGSRSGTTIIPSSHLVLVRLYDELIRSVDGYSAGGVALGSPERIARAVYGFHKA